MSRPNLIMLTLVHEDNTNISDVLVNPDKIVCVKTDTTTLEPCLEIFFETGDSIRVNSTMTSLQNKIDGVIR